MGARRHDVDGDRVQATKVQRPPLREETLARERLLDWLEVKVHHRVVLVLAEAGYGKTTLLADFSRRTRLRTLWFRLDEEDRDWVSFVRYLVAAGRQHEPGFAPRTAAMLGDGSLPGPNRDSVVEMFLRELPSIAEHGAVLIFDDFHLVDDDPDIRHVVRALVAGAPERLTLVVASRRMPNIPMGRLRALGEVAELRTGDLRFDENETARLFSETYGRALEPDVIADLSARTEGWAASLQLVQAALRDRSPTEVRRFVRNLTGADPGLNDYLAEEVVGELPNDLQDFLMRTSILPVVTPALAQLATEREPHAVRALIRAAEGMALLTRRGETNREAWRYHPLVRGFLQHRLAREFGPAANREGHLRVAHGAKHQDWRVAAHHFAEVGDWAELASVLDNATPEIMAQGDYAQAESYIDSLDPTPVRASFEVILSRVDMARGDGTRALQRAQLARALEPQAPIVLANLASIALSAGHAALAVIVAEELSETDLDDELADIGKAVSLLAATAVDGNLAETGRALQQLAVRQQSRGQSHYQGITLLNLAYLQRTVGDAPAALVTADKAVALLEESSDGPEVTAALITRAWARRVLGTHEDGQADIENALARATGVPRAEAATEAADIEIWFGDERRAAALLTEVETTLSLVGDVAAVYLASSAQLLLRQGRYDDAASLSQRFQVEPTFLAMAHKARLLAIQAHLDVAIGRPTALNSIKAARLQAEKQGSGIWTQFSLLLEAMSVGGDSLARAVVACDRAGISTVSMLAEELCKRLHLVDTEALACVQREAERRPDRWRTGLRQVIDVLEGPARLPAARLLDIVGDRSDVGRLRTVAKHHKGRPDGDLGRRLARRIALRVFVEDQGRVVLRIGSAVIEGTLIRRKVLSLLCFLITRPGFSATRDEVLEALWPDFDPTVALNSLNQTVYFLRRVIEPDFHEDSSAGYVRHESDVVWLDTELVSSRSKLCSDLIHKMPAIPTTSAIDQLAAAYAGPFALDFAYEEWAADYRDSLQASYLRIIEKTVAEDTISGHFDRGIRLARRALTIAPEADQLELSLLRLYRLSGSHAAAAEQYAHYAAMLRTDLGMEPPPLESL